jgi:hypothetical protein
MARLYGLLADAIVAFHVGYVLFVVLGLVAILLGMVFRWEWVRNRWFRCVHLAMIAFVAFESIPGIDMTCPLTAWESKLRVMAGQSPYSEDETFLGSLLFLQWPMWAFNALYIGFALVVASTFVFAPVRWRRRKAPANETAPAAVESSAAPK